MGRIEDLRSGLDLLLNLPPDAWIVPAEPFHAELARFCNAPAVVQLIDMGPSYTLIYKNRIAALFGVAMPWAGLGEAWLVTERERVRPLALRFARGARRFCGLAVFALNLRRLQIHASITSANPTFVKFARVIGFTDEARLAGFMPDGADVVLLAWKGNAA